MRKFSLQIILMGPIAELAFCAGDLRRNGVQMRPALAQGAGQRSLLGAAGLAKVHGGQIQEKVFL